MIRIGITGGLSTGKSTVLQMLVELGVPTISADAVGHRLMAPGHAPYTQIVAAFSSDVLSLDKSINRAFLGNLVFADPSKRQLLESLTHPPIWREIERWCQEHAQGGTPVVAIEVPLLFEAHLEQAVDEVWLVACDLSTQVARARSRGLTERDALDRIAAQMPLDEKARRAHRIIDTDRSLEDTKRQVSEALARVCGQRAGA